MAEVSVTKCCGRCKQEKDRSEFYRCGQNPDGLDSSCKVCRKEMNLASFAKIRNNPERWQKYLLEQKERRKSGLPEANPEKRRRRQRQHYRENKERYYCAGSKRKARKLGNGGSHCPEAWRQLKELFGNRCLCCGKEVKLTKDHVIPITRGGTDDITNIQPLCMTCNKSKHVADADFRTRDKVALVGLNEVGRLLFETDRQKTPENLKARKKLSRYVGVTRDEWKKTSKPWRAYIQVNGKLIHLGRHETEEKAAMAYNEAAKRLIGETAYANTFA